MNTWKRKPDCHGTWLFQGEYNDLRIHIWHIDETSLNDPEWLLPRGGWWFGPIPDSPVEIERAKDLTN